MAKHRKTLEEKKQAALRRQQRLQETQTTPATSGHFTYRSNGISAFQQSRSRMSIDEDSILIVPSHYIVKDLLKTVFLSLVFLGLIGVAYWYFNMGGDAVVLPYIKSIIGK